MRGEVVLQVVRGLQIVLDGPRGTVARLGSQEVECGPRGLAILDAFREPITIQDAAAHLGAGARSGAGWGEMMATIGRLRAANFLVTPGATGDAPAMVRGFASAATHVAMLDDRERTSAFLAAIRGTVRPGDVVIDLGTGTGVLAVAAARAGARHVYAIESTTIADAAAAMFAASDVADRISLVRGWSTQVDLPERADVLVSETLGHVPWAEGFLHLVADARRRLLQPAARVIPSGVRLLAEAVTVPAERRRKMAFAPASAARWTEWYGIDFAPLVRSAAAHTGVELLRPETTVDWPRPCSAFTLAEVEVSRGSAAPVATRASAIAQQDGIIDGVLLSWEADLTPAVALSTRPRVTDSTSSWRVQLALAAQPHAVRRGDRVTFAIRLRPQPCVDVSVDAGA